MPCLPLGDNRSLITGCEKHIQLSREAATEGTVLLKNSHGLLPLSKETKIAVFGKGQIDYVKGGGGSGDVYCSYTRNIYEGLKLKKGQVEVFDALSLYYQQYVEEQFKNGGWTGLFDEAPIPGDLLIEAKEYTDTAIITICRYSSEGHDKKNDGTDTSFYLTHAEKIMVETVAKNFANVIVLLNVGAMIDTSWFAYNDNISATVLLWQGGMEGGLVAADIMVGDAYPSGKLVDTCARTFEDYPSSEGFHDSEDYVKYTEDIFVGYRYFETVSAKKESVVYPFGYGLSYTTFALTNQTACQMGEDIMVSVTVTNTGNRNGKEVVQLYYNAPTGKMDKPARVLCGFEKTKELGPGESETLYITVAIKDMASYDDMGDVVANSYVLEQGAYTFYLGTDVRTATQMDYIYELEEDIVVKQLTSYGAPERLDKRMKADGTYKQLTCGSVIRKHFVCDYKCLEKPEETYQLENVAAGKIELDSFIAQLSDEELIALVGGQPNVGVANTYGMGNLEKWGIPNFMTSDGPAGVRISKELAVYTTAFPIATALACTWNLGLVEEVGKAGAREAKENNFSMWLTPALNIHRSPLCGRNFEYFSEDPFVAGKMAAAMVKGIQSQNIVATPKHFACNNKETNRKESDSIVSERALREIYLKGFEICVKEAKPKLIMTSYNRINGVRASENEELIQGVLRGEWGYEGVITSDWWTKGEHEKEVKAGNDMKMPWGEPEKLREALQLGKLSREDLCVCVKRILEMFLWLD